MNGNLMTTDNGTAANVRVVGKKNALQDGNKADSKANGMADEAFFNAMKQASAEQQQVEGSKNLPDGQSSDLSLAHAEVESEEQLAQAWKQIQTPAPSILKQVGGQKAVTESEGLPNNVMGKAVEEIADQLDGDGAMAVDDAQDGLQIDNAETPKRVAQLETMVGESAILQLVKSGAITGVEENINTAQQPDQVDAEPLQPANSQNAVSVDAAVIARATSAAALQAGAVNLGSAKGDGRQVIADSVRVAARGSIDTKPNAVEALPINGEKQVAGGPVLADIKKAGMIANGNSNQQAQNNIIGNGSNAVQGNVAQGNAVQVNAAQGNAAQGNAVQGNAVQVNTAQSNANNGQLSMSDARGISSDRVTQADATVEGRSVKIIKTESFLNPAQPANPMGARAIMQQVAGGIASETVRPQPMTQEQPTNQPVKVLQLQMTPQDLGTVTVKMRMSGEQLMVQISTQNSETAKAIEHNTHMLKDMLKAAGFRGEGVSVQMMDPNPTTGQTGQQLNQGQTQSQAQGQWNMNNNNAENMQRRDGRGQGDGQGGWQQGQADGQDDAAAKSVTNSRDGVYL